MSRSQVIIGLVILLVIGAVAAIKLQSGPSRSRPATSQSSDPYRLH